MTNNTMDTWDVMTVNSAAPDSLWAGYATANRLAAAGCPRVRLFVESVPELARCVQRIDPAVWIQAHHGFEVCDQNLATVVEPAAQVVRVFDSPLPGKYLDRLASGSPMRRLVMLQPFGRPKQGQIPRYTSSENSSLIIQPIQQGEAGRGAGFLKDGRAVDALRGTWQASHRCREATLQALGATHRPTTQTTIFVAEALGSSWLDFVRALVSLVQPIHLLIGPGPQRAAFKLIAAQYESLFGRPGKPNDVSITILPDMLWSQRDEVVWLSDLVVTSSESMASRAIQSSCPLLWSADLRMPNQNSAFMPTWYTRDIAPECARFVQALSVACGNGQGMNLNAKLQKYFSHWPEVKALAASVCERVRMSADIVDAMVAPPTPQNAALPPGAGFADTRPRKPAPVAELYF